MSENGTPDIGDFAAAFQEFVAAMTAAARHPESPLGARVRTHLGVDPQALPSTLAEFSATDYPNLQLALDSVLSGAEVLGYSARQSSYMDVVLRDLLAGNSMTGPVNLGPVQYANVQVGDGRVVQCVSAGVYLATHAGAPVALLFSRAAQRPMGASGLRVEGVSPDREAVQALLADIRAAMREHNVYRGKIISLHQRQDHSVGVQFHAVRGVERDAVILPDGILERIERHTVGIAAQVERLRGVHHHVKRGVLLHGPPGTARRSR